MIIDYSKIDTKKLAAIRESGRKKRQVKRKYIIRIKWPFTIEIDQVDESREVKTYLA